MRTLGLRVKSGFAVAVMIEGNARSWRVGRREEVLLCAPEGQYARFPFHPLVEMAAEPGVAASRAAVASVRLEAPKHLAALLESVGSVNAACVVAGSMIDPALVANPHIRAHAREGQLFREVVIDALDRARIPYEVLRDKQSYVHVAGELELTETNLRNEVDAKGRGLVRPWRADEKLATLGALCALVTHSQHGS